LATVGAADFGGEIAAARDTSVIADVALYPSLDDAEPVWRAFERQSVTTPYQRFDWLETWHRHVGARNGFVPLIVHARQANGETAFIWPLAVRQKRHLRVAGWLGCKLANYRFGLYAPGVEARLDRAALVPVFDRIRDEGGVDLLTLTNQPERWQGARNPLLAVPHQASPSHAYSLRLDPDFDTLYAALRSSSTRKKMRRRERQIAREYGSCVLRRPRTSDDVDRVLDAYFVQKTRRMQEKHIPNVFARPGVMGFFRELAVRSIGAEDPLCDLFWLDAGGQIAATWAGTQANGRMSGMITSFDEERFRCHHAGEIVLRQVIEHCFKAGLREFDLGVGEAQYKTSWCPQTDPLFDSFLPLTTLGWMPATVSRTGHRLKRAAKQSNLLTGVFQKLR